MGRLILVTGGARSGKSAHALRLAEALPAPRAFIATCRPRDEEMRRRAERHRRARAGRGWRTVEEPLDLAGAVRGAADCPAVLADCLTLWVSNLLEDAAAAGRELGEDHAAELCAPLLAAAREHPGAVILVTNEVGLGIVPESALARRFRDLAGRCNQLLAAAADEAVLTVCGLPLALKGGKEPG